MLKSVAAILLLAYAASLSTPGNKNELGVTQYKGGPDAHAAAVWMRTVLDTLSVEAKVGQLFVTHASAPESGISASERSRLIDLVENFHVGGVLFFSGDATAQADLTRALQVKSALPLLVAQDMEYGAGMRLDAATAFPSQMALGATRDPQLAYLMGKAVAEEARTMGVHQNYAPVADINNNPLNPIINVRSFGEDPELVGEMSTAYVRGMQDGGLIATVKHFPGHGDTATDSHSDLPILPFGQARLDTVELAPFAHAVRSGVKSVMIGHLMLPELDPDNPAPLSRRIVTDLLRNELGFKGLVVTDGLDMAGITRNRSIGDIAVQALEAGVDQLILTRNEYQARSAVLNAIESGRLTEERIDESLQRILEAKTFAGLADPFVNEPVPATRVENEIPTDLSSEEAGQSFQAIREAQFATLSAPNHSLLRRSGTLASEIARRSITLLQKDDSPVPFVGEDIPVSYLTIILDDSENTETGQEFAETVEALAPGGSRITTKRLGIGDSESSYTDALAQVSQHEVILVPTFVRVRSWSGQIELPARHKAFLEQVYSLGKPVILLAMGNPYIALGLPEPSAFVAAYGGSPESQRAAASALFGYTPVTGTLPISIPGMYAFGQGVSLSQDVLRSGSPEEAGLPVGTGTDVDAVITDAIESRAFPGAAIAIGRNGVLVRNTGYGHFTYSGVDRINEHSLYDLASLTKVFATTAATMKLYEEGRIDLDDRVAQYLPAFAQGGKHNVTIRQLLSHSAGQRPFYPFYAHEETQTPRDILSFIYRDPLRYTPGDRTVYSDFDMIVLGEVIEEITQQSLDQYVEETFFEPLGMSETRFLRTGRRDPTVVPTEVDENFRERLIQGEVHDEAAWMLGGVAGHAGLFSTANNLAKFAFMLANGGSANGHKFFDQETIALFTRRVSSRGRYPMALGWMTMRPEQEGSSSAGRFFGPNSYGHTGFTGTSIWIDPDQELFVVLLSNRVYPSRNNRRISNVRPALANAVAHDILAPLDRPELGLGFGTPPLDIQISSRSIRTRSTGT